MERCCDHLTSEGEAWIHLQWNPPGASQVVSCNGAESQQGRSEPALTKTIVSSLTWFPQRETFVLTQSLSIPDAAACINPYLRKRSILWEVHSTHSTVGLGLSHFSKTKGIGLAHRVDLNISFLKTELMVSSRFCDMTGGGQTAQEKNHC